MSSWLAGRGFLGTGATFAADLNLVVQVLMAAALFFGWLLARKKRFRAHGICQAAVLLLNLGMIALVMWPSFHSQLVPAFPRWFHRRYFAVAAVHGVLGIAAELLGLYIALVAGTRLVPPALRFRRFKPWMRAGALAWAAALLAGLATYVVWYIVPGF
jgi:uncharacterized membrane protein YozB (DUF420 family)